MKRLQKKVYKSAPKKLRSLWKKHRSHIFLGPLVILFAAGASLWWFGFHAHAYNNEDILAETQTATSTSITTDATTTTTTVGTDLLGTARLSYAGGTPGRNKNIELGVARIDGTIIAPGKEFSFSKTLGDSVTLDNGYSIEKVFQDGEVVKGVGGGLCQVSTLLFQSALSAGLPITERHNHTYSVSYYDLGLDATYSNPGPDLRFVNDTGHPIQIRGTAENQVVTFRIYGMSDGRQASTTEPEVTNIVDFPPTKYVYVAARAPGEPECHNTPQIGYTTHVTYDIVYPSGTKKEQVFTSVYRPLQRVCSVVGVAGVVEK